MTTQRNATKLMFHELKTREVVGRFDGGAAGHLPGFVVVDDVHVHGGIVLEVEPLPDVDSDDPDVAEVALEGRLGDLAYLPLVHPRANRCSWVPLSTMRS